MLRKVLIGNRGEIACRVLRTCRSLGVRTVAVYSDADRDALHVQLADEAYHIGGNAPAESYLRGDRLLEVARTAGAEAIHPGYGFLSENATFARQCEDAGIIFVGPPAKAIEEMGSKQRAKALMDGAGVPIVPGYLGEDQDPANLHAQAERVGFPLLIKASAGGGGKGMRRVDRLEDFDDALAAAKREAAAAFGDDHVLLERFVLQPRHIEIQVFADAHANAVYLHERECSIQRRHQKIIEEAPAPGLPADVRQRMGEAAVAAARAIGYTNAGTVEFIMGPENDFYFMEMNTRLQVEHPVTEGITGQDLVAWQLRVAAGEALPLTQEAIPLEGHAIEVRVYAEDPANDFLPTTGTLRHYREPAGARVDSGVREGDTIGVHYDPMIAKLIVHGADREIAVNRLQKALSEYEIVGLRNNLQFLRTVAAHPAFRAGTFTTAFIADHEADLFEAPGPLPREVCLLAAMALVQRWSDGAQIATLNSRDIHSPWSAPSAWRLNGHHRTREVFLRGDEEVALEIVYRPRGFTVDAGEAVDIRTVERDGPSLTLDLADGRVRGSFVWHGDELAVVFRGETTTLVYRDPLHVEVEDLDAEAHITAPMPGKVVEILVQTGQHVAKGDPLVILEAMKMEHTLRAGLAGEVSEIRYEVGDQVSEGAVILDIEGDEGDG